MNKLNDIESYFQRYSEIKSVDLRIISIFVAQ